MGAAGTTVEKENDLQDALTDALGSRRPTVINLVVDSAELCEPFRRDALNQPVRLLAKYAHLTGTEARG